VQTFIVHQVTDILSEKLHPAEVSVGSVHYKLFRRLAVDNVLVRDLKGDTLLYVKELSVAISSFNLSQKRLSAKTVYLDSGEFHLYNYRVSDDEKSTNIKDALAGLRSGAQPDTTGKAAAWQVALRNFKVSDFHFTFRNLANPQPDPRPDVVNFKDLVLRDIYIDIRDLHVAGDTVFFELKNVRALDKSGWQIRQVSARDAYLCNTQVMLRDVVVVDNFSHLTMNHYSMSYEKFTDFNDYEEQVRMEADFDDAYFSFRTIGLIAKGYKVTPAVRLTGLVSGTVDNLRGDFLQIDSETKQTKLITKFRLQGLPDIDNTMMYVNVVRLTSQVDDLTGLIQAFVPNTLLPIHEPLRPLDDIHFTGNFTGFYNNFVTNGAMRTSLGGARFDLLFDLEQEPGLRITGDAQAYRLHLGRLANAAPALGRITGAVVADAFIRSPKDGGIQLQATGKFSQVEALDYSYRNINLTGDLSNNVFDGTLSVNDPNLQLFFDGKIVEPFTNLSAANRNDLQRVLNFEANIEYADLTALRLNKRDSVSVLKAHVEADYTMTNTIDGIGNILISGVNYTGPSGLQEIGGIQVHSKYESSLYETTLRSSFLDVDYSGPRPIEGFADRVIDLMVKRPLPALDADDEKTEEELLARQNQLPASNYTFKAVFKTDEKIIDAIFPGGYVAPGTEISARLTTQDSLKLFVTSKEIALNNYRLKKISLFADNNANGSHVTLTSGEAALAGLTMRNMSSVVQAAGNKVNALVTYDNQTTPLNYGNLLASAAFSREDAHRHVCTDLQLFPSKLVINDTVWNIKESSARIFNDRITIDSLEVCNNLQSVRLHGALSGSMSDTLTLQMRNFNIANVNHLTEREGYYLNGHLSGLARVVDWYNSPRFFANLSAKQVLINDRLLGDLAVRSTWDNDEKRFRLRSYAEWDSLRTIDVTGIYSPGGNYLDAIATFNEFQLAHIEPLLKGILSNVNGTVSGEARIHGPLKDLQTESDSLYATNVSATVNYLQTHYSFNTPVILTPTSFGFRNAEMFERAGGRTTLSVMVNHRQFKDMQFDVSAYPQNLRIMNTTERDNELFYGQVFATGAVLINGRPGSTVFDINVKTERNSMFHIPALSSTQSTNMDLLTFVLPAKDTTIVDDERPELLSSGQTRNPANIDVTLNVNVTPETEIQIELDRRAGEVIRSRGTGDIKIDVNPASGKLQLFGDYSVNEGDYLFTIQNFNLISKKFVLSNGGRISFNGDLQKTMLNLSAVYRTQATLNTLIADTASVATRRPVDCTIDISGNMFSPSLKFHIDVKNLDADVQARVQSALNTEEKVTRQFLSLLAFGQFMPDQDANINTNVFFTAGTEMVSNQLNQMLSQLNVPVFVGINYVPGMQGRNDSYVGGSIGAQMWDNRVTINGIFGSGNGVTQNFSNDIDLEVKLDQRGRLNFKAFTHSVDQYTDYSRDNSQRYGLGVVYKEEFNSFPELFRNLFGKKKQPAAAVLPKKEPAVKQEEEQEQSASTNEQ